MASSTASSLANLHGSTIRIEKRLPPLSSGPVPAIHGVVRWRIVDLCQWLFEEFRVVVSKQTLSRELRALGYRKLSARPKHHAQTEGAIEEYKKNSQRVWTKSRGKKA